VSAMGSSHRVIAATLAALGSAGVVSACNRDKPATEVPGATAPEQNDESVRVPDGIEPLTPREEAERDLAGPTDEELQMMLESDEFPALLEGACGAEASCGSCGADSGS
jgi:hypothetical protein